MLGKAETDQCRPHTRSEWVHAWVWLLMLLSLQLLPEGNVHVFHSLNGRPCRSCPGLDGAPGPPHVFMLSSCPQSDPLWRLLLHAPYRKLVDSKVS